MELTFSESAYKVFASKKQILSNSRIRPDDESIWDALQSEDADFTKLPEGPEILEALQHLGE
jgi:hypothetical protein